MAIAITQFSQKREIKFADIDWKDFFKFRQSENPRPLIEQVTKPR